MVRIETLMRIERMKQNGAMTGRRDSSKVMGSNRHHVGSFGSDIVEKKSNEKKAGNDQIQP